MLDYKCFQFNLIKIRITAKGRPEFRFLFDPRLCKKTEQVLPLKAYKWSEVYLYLYSETKGKKRLNDLFDALVKLFFFWNNRLHVCENLYSTFHFCNWYVAITSYLLLTFNFLSASSILYADAIILCPALFE